MGRSSLVASFALVCSLFITCGNALFAQRYQSGSQNLFQESGYDFKGIPRYTMPKHSFIFTNTGQDELRLVAARVSCQCTKVFIPEKRLYKPGEKGEVVAQIDAVRFTGPRHVTVTVTFQRGSYVFEVPLQVTGVILENVSLTPQSLNFQIEHKNADDKTPKKPVEQTATVVYPGYNETIARVASSNPYVTVKVGKPVRVANGTQTSLTVSIKDDAPTGYVNAVVQLWSNGANGGTPLALNVSGVVRAPLNVSPSTLTFFTPANGEKITKNIVVTASSEFTLKKIESDNRAVSCNFTSRASRPTTVCVVPVTFDASKLQGDSEKAHILIQTTDGRELKLETQISSGNFESARKDRSKENAEDVETKLTQNEAQENPTNAKTDDETDDFSDAKISVSGKKNSAQENASPNAKEESKESADSNRVSANTKPASRVNSRRRDITPLTFSTSRPSRPAFRR